MSMTDMEIRDYPDKDQLIRDLLDRYDQATVQMIASEKKVDEVKWEAVRLNKTLQAKLATAEYDLKMAIETLEKHGLLDDTGLIWYCDHCCDKVHAVKNTLLGVGYQCSVCRRAVVGIASLDAVSLKRQIKGFDNVIAAIRETAEQEKSALRQELKEQGVRYSELSQRLVETKFAFSRAWKKLDMYRKGLVSIRLRSFKKDRAWRTIRI